MIICSNPDTSLARTITPVRKWSCSTTKETPMHKLLISLVSRKKSMVKYPKDHSCRLRTKYSLAKMKDNKIRRINNKIKISISKKGMAMTYLPINHPKPKQRVIKNQTVQNRTVPTMTSTLRKVPIP